MQSPRENLTGAFTPTAADPNAAPPHQAAPGPSNLSPDEQIALGDGLLAIAEQAHTHPETEAFSLSDWLTWLDEEGYDQPGLLKALQTLCQQRLTPEAYQQLNAQAQARVDAPQGLIEAIHHLENQHPELLQELQEIEQGRQSELQAMHATAGGISKKTKIELGAVGGVVGASILTGGLIGFFRAKAREKKASERVFSHLEKAAKTEVDSEIEIDAESIYIRKLNEKAANLIAYVSDKPLEHFQRAPIADRYVVPLLEQTDRQVKDSAVHLATYYKSYWNPYENRPAAKIETRMLATVKPDLYLKNFNKWVQDKHPDLASDYIKIKDIDVKLRQDFESSDDAFEFFKTADNNRVNGFLIEGIRDLGMQEFTGALIEPIQRQLLHNQRLLKEARDKGETSLELEWMNKGMALDLSESKVEEFFASQGDSPIRNAMLNNANSPLKECGVFLKDNKDYHSLLDKFASLELKRSAFVDDLRRKVREGLIDDATRKLKQRALDRSFKPIEELERKLKDEAKTYFRQTWADNRVSLATRVEEAADDAARKEAMKQLADMDDVVDWFESRGETTAQELKDYLRLEAYGELEAIYDAAEEAARNAGSDIEII